MQCFARGNVLFMVIETFKNGDPLPVRERFQRAGRMLPEGVAYVASWIDPVTAQCYQVMEAESEDALALWTSRWSDLVDFKIVPVLSSPDYWARFDQGH